MMTALLALDLGQHTGWAVRTKDGEIVSGTNHFVPGRFEGGGMIWIRFRSWLEEMVRSAECEAIVFEEVRRHRGVAAAHVYGGFLSHLTAFAEGQKPPIPYQGVPVGTIKRHATGKGNANKEDMIAAMVARGYHPGDDNEADALALLHWAIENYSGTSSAQSPRLALRASSSKLYTI